MVDVLRSPLIARDFDTSPFSRDERRVCDYLQAVAPDIGCGDDPIGFLIASHATLAATRKIMERRAETALSRTDLPVPDAKRPALGGDPMRPHRASSYLSARDHPLSTSAMGATRDP